MKHKMFFAVVALVLLQMLIASPIRAAEITIDWRQKLDSGEVSDLKFMPGKNTFIHNTGYETQIRNCEDGVVIAKYPIKATQYEFTPDSSKLVMLNGFHAIQIRNLSDMSLVNEVERIFEPNGYSVTFQEILVDPVRPLVYARWEKTKGQHETYEEYGKILIFDRETLQQVGELTSGKDTNLYFAKIAISKDGKYLAAMNNKASKLIVWTLDTRQKVVDKYISDQNSDKWSSSADIKFSELNTDKIFFTGQFYKSNNDVLAGLCIFSIKENRIIDSTFAIPPNRYGTNPEICLFENETKVIGASGITAKILDIIGKKIEFEKNILGNNLVAVGNVNYHNYEKYFVGGGGNTIDKFNYQPNTSVPTENPKEVIYPNPTSGIVNIPLNCINSSKYEIYNTIGRLVNSTEITNTSINLLSIDFSQYSAGVYSLKVYCGKKISSFQIIKEG